MEGWSAPFSEVDDPLPGEVVPYVPTPQGRVAAMFRLCPLDPARDVVVDLGCGDGRIPIHAASLGCRALGVDINPALVATAASCAAVAGVSHLCSFTAASFLAPDFAIDPSVTVVALYIVPKVLKALEPMLKSWVRAANGRRVVSATFPFARWAPFAVDSQMQVFVYDSSSADMEANGAYVDAACNPAF